VSSEAIRTAAKAGEPSSLHISPLHSIKVKTWFGIFLISLVPLAILGFYAVSVLTGITRDLLIKSNLQAVQQVKAEIDRYVTTYEELARHLRNDARLAVPTSPEAVEALRQMDFSYEFIDRIVLCASDGAILAHSAKTAGAIPGLSEIEQQVLTSSDTVRFGQSSFAIRLPLRETAGSPTLVMTASFLKLRKTLEGMMLGTTFRYFLVTRSGENLLEPPGTSAGLVERLMNLEFGGYDITGPRPEDPPRVAVILPILHHDLRIIVVQDAGEVYSIVHQIKWNISLVILVVMIIAFSAGTAFSMRITSPIIAIADKVTRISGGDLRGNVISNRRDEIGFLASCFNDMTSRIRKKVFELSAMYRISQIINNAPTYQKALDEALVYIVTIFLAKRGSIMLVAEHDDQLVLRSVHRFGEEKTSAASLQERITLRVGEGIAGLALSTGQPVVSNDCATDPRFKKYPPEHEAATPGRLLSLPLIVQGKAFGVINISDYSDNLNFPIDDQDILLTIASQVAMSSDNARLHELAITDGLTQLFIHRYFQIKLDDEIKRAKRYDEPLALLMFDIDHFKRFNDTYGHQQGDNVLRETAKIIRDAVRGSDIPCRYGGEEFAVILPHTTAEQALIFAERLRVRVNSHPFLWGEEQLHVSISIGISEYPLMAADKVTLIRKADKALYHCKERGRNCTSIYTDEVS